MKKILKVLLLILTIFSVYSAGGENSNNLSKIYEQLGLSMNVSYSADMEITPASKNQPNLKVFYKNGNMRTEGSANGMQIIMIMSKNGVIYSYNDQMKSWIKTETSVLFGKENPIPDYKKIGTEILDDKNCEKFESVEPKMNIKTTVWINDGIIYKNSSIMPNAEEQIVKYKNIEKKELNDALFTPPAGAQIQDMSEMLKNFMPKE